MTIAIQIDPAFDVETYDGLIAYIIAHLELDSESSQQVPTFIRKAEYRLDRLCTVPQRENSITRIASIGDQVVPLPSDCRSVLDVQSDRTLKQVSLATLNDCYTEEDGIPDLYAVSNLNLLLGPTPSEETNLEITYLTRLPPLSAQNQANWLLSNNADAYIYGALFEASTWLEDLDAAAQYRAEMLSIIGEVNEQAQQYRFSTPLLPNLVVM